MNVPQYTAPGRCIYCDSTQGLSREHIIPAGLKGDLVLPAASCSACSAITSRIEMYCLRVIYGLVRGPVGIYSSRRKKTRPTALRVIAEELGIESTEYIPYSQLPSLYVELQFVPPGLISKGPVTAMWPEMKAVVSSFHSDYQARIDALGANLKLKFEISPKTLCAMLAKIAHSYAVAVLGIDGFIPLVRNVCLSKCEEPWMFVGSEWTPTTAADGSLHQLELRYDPTGYIVVNVWLFSQYKAHQYAVIVGVPN